MTIRENRDDFENREKISNMFKNTHRFSAIGLRRGSNRHKLESKGSNQEPISDKREWVPDSSRQLIAPDYPWLHPDPPPSETLIIGSRLHDEISLLISFTFWTANRQHNKCIIPHHHLFDSSGILFGHTKNAKENTPKRLRSTSAMVQEVAPPVPSWKVQDSDSIKT